jgi:hypothetical protein
MNNLNIQNYIALVLRKRASEPPGVVSKFLEMFSFHKTFSNLLAKICVLKNLQAFLFFLKCSLKRLTFWLKFCVKWDKMRIKFVCKINILKLI